MSEQFSTRLRDSTATIHNEVEHTNFMVDLMEGRLDAHAYATLLRQYDVIYASLEAKAREFADNPIFAPFHDPRLDRSARITHDLGWLHEESIALVSSARDYAAHIDAIESPEQMIAHHYTRYLGDLSGGQAIGTLMARHYGLGADVLTMWDFTDIGKSKPYKDAYRRRLDEIADTGGDEQRVVDETMTAFELNGTMLEELTKLTRRQAAPVA